MWKKAKRILTVSVLLLVLVLSGLPLSNTAKAEDGVFEIRSKSDWLRFAKNCRTDIWSEGLTVELKSDLNLSGEAGAMVPVFCGTFHGGGHSITGLWLEVSTDTTGLFRVLEENASVSGLTVYGGIKTEKERSITGILCGENKGTIQNCRVYGYLKSYEDTGAVAGKNSGIIEQCTSQAEVIGTYRTGGIAGTNEGRLEGCQNSGKINPEANEAAVNTGGISGANNGEILSCTNSGDIGYLHTGYNVGGICGISRGFIEGCKNSGKVFGRRDVGGICGQMEPSFRLEYGKNAMQLLDNNLSGFTDSLNGALAMVESAFNEGAFGLNDLIWQLNGFVSGFSDNVSWLFSQTSWVDDARGYLELIRGELEQIKESLAGRGDTADITFQMEILLESFTELDPALWEGKLEELSQLIGQLSLTLEDVPFIGDHVSNLSGAFRALAETVVSGFQDFGNNSTWILEDTASQLSGLRENLAGFLGDTGEDISSVRESVGGALDALSALQASVEDVLNGKESQTEDLSAQISARDNGMIITSENSGEVSADYNVGGILGNLSAELSLNQESEASPSLDDLLFTDTTLFVRATVHACRNSGEISAKYDYAGGISGYGTRGAVLNCENSGNVRAERSYAGGLGGRFRGRIENGASIGKVSSLSYAGGLAGEAKAIYYSIAVPELEPDGANFGAVAGALDEGSGNLFVNETFGAVNGITYSEVAREVSYRELLETVDVPRSFRNLTVRFLVDGKEVKKVLVPYGDPFPEFPEEEVREDAYWSWDEPEEDTVYHSQDISGSWKHLITTLATEEDPPMFLAEGVFTDDAKLKAEELDASQTEIPGSPGESFAAGLIRDLAGTEQAEKESQFPEKVSYRITVENSDAEEFTLRYLQENDGWIYVEREGNIQKANVKRDGKYLVFQMNNGEAFTFVKGYDLAPLSLYWNVRLWMSAALALAALIGIIVGLTAGKKAAKPV